MRKLFVVLAVGLSISALAQVAQAGSFTDTFDTIHPDWKPDRHDPAGFEVVNIGGDNRLQLSIAGADQSSTFYNTQGRRRDVGVEAPWRVSADIFISEAFRLGGAPLFRTDLWTRDSHPVEGSSNYAILGFTNQSTATASGFRLQAFDSQIGWIDLGLPGGLNFDDWNTLTIEGTGSSFVFKLNDEIVHTDTSASAIGNENLRTVYLEAYNFGSDYSVLWDNVSAQTIPTPAAMGVGVLGFGLLALRRGRRSSAT